jgi:hypothetical protein
MNLAQIKLYKGESLSGYGTLGEGQGEGSVGTFTKFISSAVGLITIIGIIWFVFILVTGAIGIISAGGDKQALETARKKITTGIIGLVIIIAALFIIDLFGYLIGIENILDLPALFGQIQQ